MFERWKKLIKQASNSKGISENCRNCSGKECYCCDTARALDAIEMKVYDEEGEKDGTGNMEKD